MKRLARALLRPFLRPIILRLHTRVVFWAHETTDERFVNLEAQLGALGADVEGMERYVPALLNAIANQNAMRRAETRSDEELTRLVSSVLEQLGALRDEVRTTRQAGLDGGFEPKVLRPDALAAAGADLRIVLGPSEPGADHRYLRVDTTATETTDVLAGPGNLPFDPGSVAEIRAAGLLERFSIAQVTETLLPHWVRVLAPGGSLVVSVSDIEAVVRAYVAGTASFDALREVTFGDGTDEGRRTMFDGASLVGLLRGAGLTDVVIRRDPAASRPEIEAVGTKPLNPTR
jgi:hypothetical protein